MCQIFSLSGSLIFDMGKGGKSHKTRDYKVVCRISFLKVCQCLIRKFNECLKMLTSVDACRIPTSCDNNTNFASCFKDTCLKILLHANEKNTKGKSKLKTGHFTGAVKRMNVLRLANVII